MEYPTFFDQFSRFVKKVNFTFWAKNFRDSVRALLDDRFLRRPFHLFRNVFSRFPFSNSSSPHAFSARNSERWECRGITIQLKKTKSGKAEWKLKTATDRPHQKSPRSAFSFFRMRKILKDSYVYMRSATMKSRIHCDFFLKARRRKRNKNLMNVNFFFSSQTRWKNI